MKMDGRVEEIASKAWSSPAGQTIVNGFGVSVKGRDVILLKGNKWLNDEIVNFYLKLLCKDRSETHVLDSQFYNKLMQGYSYVKNWTKKINIFQKSTVLVPLFINNCHWCLAVILPSKEEIIYFDSYHEENMPCLEYLKNYLGEEAQKLGHSWHPTRWKLKAAKDIPFQTNGFDCGVFMCQFAKHTILGIPLKGDSFSETHMPKLRKLMVYEIVQECVVEDFIGFLKHRRLTKLSLKFKVKSCPSSGNEENNFKASQQITAPLGVTKKAICPETIPFLNSAVNDKGCLRASAPVVGKRIPLQEISGNSEQQENNFKASQQITAPLGVTKKAIFPETSPSFNSDVNDKGCLKASSLVGKRIPLQKIAENSEQQENNFKASQQITAPLGVTKKAIFPETSPSLNSDVNDKGCLRASSLVGKRIPLQKIAENSEQQDILFERTDPLSHSSASKKVAQLKTIKKDCGSIDVSHRVILEHSYAKPPDDELKAASLDPFVQGLLNDHKDEKYANLNSILPSDFNYCITHFTPHNDDSKKFHAEMRVNLSSKSEAEDWLKDFEAASSTDWRQRKAPDVTKSNRLRFKKVYRCHHDTRAECNSSRTLKPHEKHTLCPAYLRLTVKAKNMTRSTDPFLPHFPAVITISHHHNHPICAADTLRHRRPSVLVQNKFLDYFEKGHSPRSALKDFKFALMDEEGDLFFKTLADGSKCPSIQWCYRLFYQKFQKTYGDPCGEEMIESLKGFVEKYNESCKDTCASVIQTATDLTIALCSPLMKRVHTHLRASGEVMFVDSGGGMDRYNSRVFLFLAPSVVGALPVGIIITTSESTSVLTAAFEQLSQLFPPGAFYGRGMKGPSIIMTDDSTPERDSLQAIFSEALLLLCQFHVLQALWTYLWDGNHKVHMHHRSQLMELFKSTVRIREKDEFYAQCAKVLQDPLLNQYPDVHAHYCNVFSRASEWATCYRTEILLRGHDTNNYSEANIRNVKDDILDRLKSYNVVQLFDFFTTRLNTYYELRIVAVLNNRLPNYTKSRYYVHPQKLLPLEVSVIDATKEEYEVKNTEKGTSYHVNLALEACSCPVGFNGASCKHQCAVIKKFGLSSAQFLPYCDTKAKLELHYIMAGNLNYVDEEWYTPLKAGIHQDHENVFSATENIPVDPVASEVSPPPSETKHSESTKSFTEAEFKDTEENLEKCFKFLRESVRSRPEVFIPAVNVFSERFLHAADRGLETALVSGLHSFNCEHASHSTRGGRKYINVNSKSMKRRTAYIGGRKVALTGRPPKEMLRKRTGSEPNWAVPPKKKSRASHDIAKAIRNNKSNGKNHSRKE